MSEPDTYRIVATQPVEVRRGRFTRGALFIGDDGKIMFYPEGTVLSLPFPAGPLELKTIPSNSRG